jgi:hypothetical protein
MAKRDHQKDESFSYLADHTIVYCLFGYIWKV